MRYETYSEWVTEQQQESRDVKFNMWGKLFRREVERMLLMPQHPGSVQCPHCDRWTWRCTGASPAIPHPHQQKNQLLEILLAAHRDHPLTRLCHVKYAREALEDQET